MTTRAGRFVLVMGDFLSICAVYPYPIVVLTCDWYVPDEMVYLRPLPHLLKVLPH